MRALHTRTFAILAAAAFLTWATGTGFIASRVSAEAGGPTVVLTTSTATTTNASSYDVTATFSEDVTGFDAGDVTVTNGSVSNFASSSASEYTFDVTPAGDGTVEVSIPEDVATGDTSSLGNQPSNTITFESDTTDPVISNVTASTTSSTATITWETDEAATGYVSYGTSDSYGATSTMTSAGTEHSVTIAGLDDDTEYHYQITVEDAAGNTATSSDQTFTTDESLAAPTISNLAVGTTSTSSVTISWDTDTPATTQVNYGTTTSYGQSSAYDSALTTNHSVTLTGLDEATQYFVEAVSGNAAATSTATTTFTTSSTASTTPLAIDETESVDSDGIANGEWADGWEWLLTFTVPDNETQFEMRFTDFTSNGDTLPAAGNIRYFTSQSDTATSSENAVVIDEAGEYGDPITLTGDMDSATPGRQVQVTVQVKIPFGTPEGSYSTTFGARTDTP